MSRAPLLSLLLCVTTTSCGRGGPDAPMFALIGAMVAIGVVAAALVALAVLSLVVALIRAVRRGERRAAVAVATGLLVSCFVGLRLAGFADSLAPSLQLEPIVLRTLVVPVAVWLGVAWWSAVHTRSVQVWAGLGLLSLGVVAYGGYLAYAHVEATPVLPLGSVSGGREHACGVDASGRVVCLGWDAHGAMGPTYDGGYTPAIVPGVDGAVSVSAASESTCALLADHTVRCWGIDPRDPSGARTWTFDDAGEPSALVVTEDDVYALDRDGTLRALARPIPGAMTHARIVAATTRHLCIALEDGVVRCRVGGLGHELVVDIEDARDASALAVAWVDDPREDDSPGLVRGCAVARGALRCWTLDRTTRAVTTETVATDAIDVRILEQSVVWTRVSGELVSVDLFRLDERPLVISDDFATIEATSPAVVCGRSAEHARRCVAIGARPEREPLLDLVDE